MVGEPLHQDTDAARCVVTVASTKRGEVLNDLRVVSVSFKDCLNQTTTAVRLKEPATVHPSTLKPGQEAEIGLVLSARNAWPGRCTVAIKLACSSEQAPRETLLEVELKVAPRPRPPLSSLDRQELELEYQVAVNEMRTGTQVFVAVSALVVGFAGALIQQMIETAERITAQCVVGIAWVVVLAAAIDIAFYFHWVGRDSRRMKAIRREYERRE